MTISTSTSTAAEHVVMDLEQTPSLPINPINQINTMNAEETQQHALITLDDISLPSATLLRIIRQVTQPNGQNSSGQGCVVQKEARIALERSVIVFLGYLMTVVTDIVDSSHKSTSSSNTAASAASSVNVCTSVIVKALEEMGMSEIGDGVKAGIEQWKSAQALKRVSKKQQMQQAALNANISTSAGVDNNQEQEESDESEGEDNEGDVQMGGKRTDMTTDHSGDDGEQGEGGDANMASSKRMKV